MIVTLITLFGLFCRFPLAKAYAVDPDQKERPLIEDPTGEEDDSVEKTDEPDFDEKDLEDLDPWFFENDGKDADPADKNRKDQPKEEEPKTRTK